MEFVAEERNRSAAVPEQRTRFAALAPLFLLLAAGCRSLELSPAALRAPGGRPAERAAALARWQEAIELANEFLASDYRRTLPAGRFELAPDGMSFQSAQGARREIEVCSSTWGDLVVATGFRAQEARYGFCVGATGLQEGETRDGQLDNSFFRMDDGSWHDSQSLAHLVLHETTHVVYGKGAVGLWNTLGYYLVAIGTFSAAHHPAEDRPRATGEEFAWFCAARTTAPEYRSVIENVRDEHLAKTHEHCEHGPFPASP